MAADRVRLALESTGTGVWVWDLQSDALRWSGPVGPLHGLPEGAQAREHEPELHRAIPAEDQARLREHLTRALGRGESFTEEYRVILADGDVRWLGTRGHVVRGAGGEPVELIGLVYDVTDRRRLQESSDLLARASEALAQSLDPFRTLREIAQLAVPGRADWCAVHVVREDGHIDTLAVAHVDPEQRRVARALASRFPPQTGGEMGAARVIRTGRSELHEEIEERQLVAWTSDAEQRRMLEVLRPRSSVVVPLLARGRALGAITFTYTGSGRRYGPSDLAVAEELGRRAGLALDHARLYERRQRTATTLQRALLPRAMPRLAGYEVVPAYLAAQEGDEAGGDWYDAFLLPGGLLGLVIGDVVGHGVEAAAVMGQLRHGLRAYALVEPDPARVIELLGEMSRVLTDATFATVAYATLDPVSGRLRYASAGHLPPVMVGADGSCRVLEGGISPPLATLRGRRPEPIEAELEPRGTLVLYTDGLVEDRSRPLDQGIARLCEIAATRLPLGDLVPRIVQEMDTPDSRDDVAVLAVRRSV